MAGKKSSAAQGMPRRGFHWLRVTRLVVATLVLMAFLGVFVDFRHAIEGWFVSDLGKTQFVPAWQSVLAGALWPSLAIFAALVIGALIFGRIYCSFLCPFGILQDVVSWVARLFKKGRNKAYKYAPAVRWVRPAVIALIVIATLAGLGSVVWAWLDPYSQFGRFAALMLRPLVEEGNNAIATSFQRPPVWLYAVKPEWQSLAWAFVPMGLLLLLAGVFAAWRGRLYCNTVCPVGAILGLLSRVAALRVRIDKSACTKCARCMKSCKSQCIDLKTSTIDASRCVNCFDCVSVCDNRGISYRFSWTRDKGKPKPPKPKKDKPSGPNDPHDVPSEGSPVMVMMPATDRRTFLGMTAAGVLTSLSSCAERNSGGLIRAATDPRAISPPGSGSIPSFLASCTGCQLCVAACPGKCLKPAYLEYGAAGLFKPRMDYHDGFCEFNCTTCSNVCPTGAILPLGKEAKKLEVVGKADLDLRRCIAANDKNDCGACAEHCPTAALEMVRFKQPKLTPRDCVSCLKCKEVCPKGAITYTQGRRKKPIFDYAKCIGCGDCVPGCEGSALHMEESQYDVRVPTLYEQYCIGCGGCEYICPPRTINVRGIVEHQVAEVRVYEEVVNPNEGVDFAF